MTNPEPPHRKSQRPAVAIPLAAFAAMAAAFLLLQSLHVLLPTLLPFDLAFQAYVHAWTNPALTRIMQALTFIGSIQVFVPALIFALAVFLLAGSKKIHQRFGRKRQVVAIFALGVGGAMILNESLKLYFHRARPDVPWSIGSEPTFSFPSGHALFATVLYGLIFYTATLSRPPAEWSQTAIRTHLPLFALSSSLIAGIGISRIYLGMHWPTDVLAGFITGGCWLVATIFIDRRLVW